MRKNLLQLLLIYTGFEVLREVGNNISYLVRDQPAFTGWTSRVGILLNVSAYVIFALFPLVTYVLFQRFYRQSKRKTLLFWFISVIIIITLRYLVEELAYPHFFDFRNYPTTTPLFYYFFDNTYFAFLFSAFGGLYYFMQVEQKQRIRETELQLTNKQTELSFLRSQVNPHFLFNSLNSIYSLVYHESEQSLTAIAKLSDLLRYMLYDTHEKVPLQKEMDYINKYVELQQIRFEHAPPIQQDVTGPLETIHIPPLLLIPFVENAFKHGDLKSTRPMAIQVRVQGKDMHFAMSNLVGHHQKDSTGGIGLENVRRRLQLLYPGQHTLNIQQTNDIFEVQLHIWK